MKKTPKVVLSIETSREYGRQLLTGIAHYASLHGPWHFCHEVPFYYHPRRHTSQLTPVLSVVGRGGADGIIVRESPAHMDKIRDLGIPTIVVTYTERTFEGLITVEGDCANAGRLAAEHFLDRGFKNFGYCGIRGLYWSVERGLGFQERVARAGRDVVFYEYPKGNAKSSREKNQAHLTDWVRHLAKPVAVMACTDDRARDVVEACKVAGIAVPEDVAVIGVDNDPLVCSLTNPPLSSVALNAREAGYQAAMALHRLMNGEKVDADSPIVAKATHVVARRSTDVLAVEDVTVARALHFIHENASSGVQVRDVVDHSGLKLRALQKRFREHLGRSIVEELDHVHIDCMCRLLMETPKTIRQIATECGFLSEGHIARYFRRRTGMTPREYRRQHKYYMG